MCVKATVLVMLMPPLSFFRNEMFGGLLLMRTPNPSSSLSMTRLSVRGLLTSSTMKMRWHVFATAMTCLPRPLPSFAPSIIPGKSSIWILAPLYMTWPGTVVSVVNSYAATSECCPVSRLIRVLLPTDGKPINPTLATPVRATSKPTGMNESHGSAKRVSNEPPPPPPPPDGVSNSRLSFASLAFN